MLLVSNELKGCGGLDAVAVMRFKTKDAVNAPLESWNRSAPRSLLKVLLSDQRGWLSLPGPPWSLSSCRHSKLRIR